MVNEQPAIDVYALSGCPHCSRATRLLRRRGASYNQINGDADPRFRSDMQALTGGWTVPQIVIGDTPIGGADQLARLDRLGLLETIIAGGPFPIVRTRRRVFRPKSKRWSATTYGPGGVQGARATGPTEAAAREALGYADPARPARFEFEEAS